MIPAATCGRSRRRHVGNGRKFYGWRNAPFIPVEFPVAAYRFGHSRCGPATGEFGHSATEATQQVFAMIFDPASTARPPRPARRLPRAAIHRLATSSTSATGGEAQQADRHQAVVGAFPSPRSAGDQPIRWRSATCSATSRSRRLPVSARRSDARHPLSDSTARTAPVNRAPARTPLWYYILQGSRSGSHGQHSGPSAAASSPRSSRPAPGRPFVLPDPGARLAADLRHRRHVRDD